MSLPSLGSFGGDQTSQSLQTSFKQSLQGIGTVTVGGSGGSSSGRGGSNTPSNANSLLPIYVGAGFLALLTAYAIFKK
jgi:hypothetical protein